MPGRSSKQKGYRIEREVVELHADMGVPCERVPLSGAAGGSYTGDLVIGPPGLGLHAEVKARAKGQGFAVLERWLSTHSLLFLRRDRAEHMVVMPWSVYRQLMQCWYANL